MSNPMFKLFYRLAKFAVVAYCALIVVGGIMAYADAAHPLVAKFTTPAAMWKVDVAKENGAQWQYYLTNGVLRVKVCGNVRGYSECGRFMNQTVSGVCSLPATTTTATSGAPTSCKQTLSHRLEAEPLVVAYSDGELVSINTADGKPVLSTSEWANIRQSYLQRKAMWSIGVGLIVGLICLA